MKVFFKQKKHDYPKKVGDLSLAWYAGGNVCIVRRKADRLLQKQNLSIIQINQITRMIWEKLAHPFKKDLAKYAHLYKKQYPGLRKRGISSYAVFLMISHSLVRRFSLNISDSAYCSDLLIAFLKNMTVKKAIDLRLLKKVNRYYCLNHENSFQICIIIDCFSLISTKIKDEIRVKNEAFINTS